MAHVPYKLRTIVADSNMISRVVLFHKPSDSMFEANTPTRITFKFGHLGFPGPIYLMVKFTSIYIVAVPTPEAYSPPPPFFVSSLPNPTIHPE